MEQAILVLVPDKIGIINLSPIRATKKMEIEPIIYSNQNLGKIRSENIKILPTSIYKLIAYFENNLLVTTVPTKNPFEQRKSH